MSDVNAAASPPTPRLTEPGLGYYIEMERVTDFLSAYDVGLTFSRNRIDTVVAAYEQSLKAAKIPEERFRSRLTRNYDPLVVEMAHCRLVDAFLVYVTDLLALIYRTKPQVLMSDEQVKLDFILRFATMEDLIVALAEQQVEKRAFLGLQELSKYFDTRLRLPLLLNDYMLDNVAEAVEIRNIIVHNHGRVSPTFKRRLPNYPAEVGDRIQVKYPSLGLLALRLTLHAYAIDKRAAEKFGLPTYVVEDTA